MESTKLWVKAACEHSLLLDGVQGGSSIQWGGEAYRG